MEDHWTRDTELLERFVRGALTATERQPLEQHLRVCPPCRSAVENERTLAAGIRRTGRSDLRAGLRRRIDARSGARTPWPAAVRVAAVLLVVAGIALAARWLTVMQRPDDTLPTIADLKRGDPENAEPDGPPLREKSSPLVDSAPATAGQTGPAKEVPAEEKDRGKSRTVQAIPAPAVRAESNAAAAEAGMNAQEYAVQDASVPAPASNAEHRARRDAAPTPLIVLRAPGPAGEALSAEMSGGIPWLAEMRGDTLVVRVLTPPPAGAEDSDPLGVELIGADSLILRFTDVTLRVKLPGALPGGILLLETR